MYADCQNCHNVCHLHLAGAHCDDFDGFVKITIIDIQPGSSIWMRPIMMVMVRNTHKGQSSNSVKHSLSAASLSLGIFPSEEGFHNLFLEEQRNIFLSCETYFICCGNPWPWWCFLLKVFKNGFWLKDILVDLKPILFPWWYPNVEMAQFQIVLSPQISGCRRIRNPVTSFVAALL